MNIKTPVKVIDDTVIQESDGALIGDFVTTDLAIEGAKRINMYDALVDALKENVVLWEMVCDSKGWEPEHVIPYVKAKELLEKCK